MYKSSFIHIYLKHVYSQTSFIKAYNTMYFLFFERVIIEGESE